MTEQKRNKPKPLKEYALAAQERLRKISKPQNTKKPSNFRPQGRGR